MAGLVVELRALQAEEQQLRASRQDAARRLDLLRYQVDEINAAGLRPDEEAELDAERMVLGDADRLAALAGTALALLSEGDEGEHSALDLLNRAALAIGDLARIDHAQAPLLENLQTALYTLEEVARDLTRYAGGIDANPARLAALEERASQLQSLKRKYGATLAEVIEFGRQAAAEMESLLHAEDRLEGIAAEAERLRATIGRDAAALSAARRAAADDLAHRVEEQLADLNMARAHFAIGMERRPNADGVPLPGEEGRYACDETGIDRVEFQNFPQSRRGSQAAGTYRLRRRSSRLMLALKTILSGG